jgi:hypothetical protein
MVCFIAEAESLETKAENAKEERQSRGGIHYPCHGFLEGPDICVLRVRRWLR